MPQRTDGQAGVATDGTHADNAAILDDGRKGEDTSGNGATGPKLDAREHEQAVNHANRMLCGSAYRKGMGSGLALLELMRRGRCKAASPETNLDLEQIAAHASQAVLLTLLFSIAALGTFLAQLLLMGGLALSELTRLDAPDSVASSLVLFGSSLTLIGLSFVGAGLVAYERYYLRGANACRFLKRRFQPEAPVRRMRSLTRWFQQRILQVDPSQNVVTFGGYSPFLGAGRSIAGWTLAIERKPPRSADEQRTISIPAGEFYRAIDAAVARLSLPDLQASSLLFVKGTGLEPDGEVLRRPEARPLSRLPEDRLWQLGHGDLASGKRFYRLYRYIDTTRDMALSYYLRFDNVGAVTFVEGSVYTLTSVDEARYGLGLLLRDSPWERLWKTAVMTLGLTFFSLYAFVALFQITRFLGRLYIWHLRDSSQRRAIRKGEQYNYAEAQTFREHVSASFYQDYYGVQDLTMYRRALDETVFSGLIELLQQHGVDVSQFEKQAAIIINSGIMVSGGRFTATQVAAGSGATSIMDAGGDGKAGGSSHGVPWLDKVRGAASVAAPSGGG